MYDKKKLEAFLDSLMVEKCLSKIKPPHSPLDGKMDKYDIFKQDDYENVGTGEFPVLARKQGFQFGFSGSLSMPAIPQTMWATYGGLQRQMYEVTGFSDDAPTPPGEPVETQHHKLVKQIAQLESVAAAKIADPKPTPPAPAKSPDYVGTITAWRGWAVEDGLLEALGSDFKWPIKHASRAHCVNEHHPAPQMNCSCGFWSFRSLEHLTEAMAGYISSVMVIGTVEIWGRVIECKNGWRSEFAYPKELWLLKPGLEHLSWDYGVPVRQL